MGGEPNRGPMMTRICWRLVDILSRMLDADERQVVRGDFAESGQSVARAIRDVSDLLIYEGSNTNQYTIRIERIPTGKLI